jgi:carboxyl-terminal processing protease
VIHRAAYAGLILAVGLGVFVYVLSDPLYTSLGTMTRATALIQERGVYDATAEELKYATIAGLVSGLDDYSTWHDRVADTTIRREARGHYGGFGIEIVSFGDTTTIWQVFDDSPARKAGLKFGDRLILADTIHLVGLPLDSVHAILAAIPEDVVPLSVYRPGAPDLLVIDCGRGDIDVGTVTVVAREDSLALIAIGGFNGRTAPALERALDTLKRSGTRRFILDLRGNPGGLLTAAVECAGLFMPQAGVVTSVTGIRPEEEITMPRGPFPDLPLVILVDGGSASGSELLAGCLQDWDRAVLVGQPTFGKGFIQNLYGLVDESSLRLTVGQYHTPCGRTFYRPDSTRAVDTTHYRSLVSGRAIVGGGQIFPDIEAPRPDCPVHLGGLFGGRALFDFAVDLNSTADSVTWGPELVDRFWASYDSERYVGLYARALDSLATVAFPHVDAALQAALADAETRERKIDKAQAADCVLLGLARYLRRANHDVPLLRAPLLDADFALATAVDLLRRPGWQARILAGAAE